MRFEHVLARVGAQGRPRWDALAADAGYADQAHLIRDFRAFAGLTPTAYLERLRGRPQPFRPGIPFKTAPRSTP